jgi:lambda repressor-like predicted transcriptional regulator
MKPKEKALELRKAGFSYSYISAKTGLSKSTLSYQLAQVPYTPNKKTLKLSVRHAHKLVWRSQ